MAGAQGGKRGQGRAQLLDRAIHQISDDGDEIRVEALGGMDDPFDERAPEKSPHVHVAKLDDARAVEAGGGRRERTISTRLTAIGPRVARTAAAVIPPTLASAAPASTRAVKVRREPSKGFAIPNHRLPSSASKRRISVDTSASRRMSMAPIQMKPGQASTRPRRGTGAPRDRGHHQKCEPATLVVASLAREAGQLRVAHQANPEVVVQSRDDGASDDEEDDESEGAAQDNCSGVAAESPSIVGTARLAT